MKCPHCLVDFHDVPVPLGIGTDVDGQWMLVRRHCPACKRIVLYLENGVGQINPANQLPFTLNVVNKSLLVWPKGISRAPCPAEVPVPLIEDYNEACLVLSDSPKASAALSRRCLQTLLRESVKVKPGDLYDEIQQVIDSKTLPSTIAESIDAVRVIGNFAAHPTKSKNTGEVVPVGPDEAEWNLDVLESLFDFYFVLPARAKAKKDVLNKKLQDAGKPPLR
jgi:hypothetical protein